MAVLCRFDHNPIAELKKLLRQTNEVEKSLSKAAYTTKEDFRSSLKATPLSPQEPCTKVYGSSHRFEGPTVYTGWHSSDDSADVPFRSGVPFCHK